MSVTPTPTRIPQRVFLFSGHCVDAAGRTPPRFPLTLVDKAAAGIAAKLDALGAGPDDLALTQGANGGDLLFAEACLARRVPLRFLQPFDEATFIEASVRGDPKLPEDWVARYRKIRAQLIDPPLAAPTSLGPLPDGGDPYERCNRWLLDSALAWGAERLHFICLWNGDSGEAAGGTADMVAEVTRRGGTIHWLDTRNL